MCGIAGIVKYKEAVSDEEIVLMKQSIYHRGPDAQKHFLEGGTCLVSTRLSILDLSSSADMPVVSAHGEAVIVYNGEVYNFREIRRDLEQKGYQFKTSGDTEVVLNAYLEYGTDCFNLFNGMFGLCIFDRRSRKLVLARDRFGKKNVYFSQQNGHFSFSSELKTFAQLMPGTWQVNTTSVLQLLAFDNCEQPLLQNVELIRPGAFVIYDIDTLQVARHTYFTPLSLIDADYSRELAGLSYPDLKTRFHQTLKDSVNLRLISDAPVAVMCSGGVDSSLVSILAKQQNPNMEGYLVDVPNHQLYSEKVYAEQIARKFNLHLNVFELTREAYLNKMVDTIYHNDMPDAHLGSSIGVYYLSRQARDRGIKVVLSGEAADEIFGGYTHRYRRFLVARKLTGVINKLLPAKLRQFVYDYNHIEVKNNLKDIGYDDFLFLALRKTANRDHYHQIVDRYRSIGMAQPELSAMMLWDLTTYITSILVRNDRATMHASIESRTPFLDPNLVRFAANMPLRYKVDLRHDKRIVKDTLADYMGKSFAYRKKMGFGVPNYLFETNYRKLMKDGFVEQHFGNEIYRYAGNEMLFRKFIQLEIWHKLFIENQSRDVINQSLLHT